LSRDGNCSWHSLLLSPARRAGNSVFPSFPGEVGQRWPASLILFFWSPPIILFSRGVVHKSARAPPLLLFGPTCHISTCPPFFCQQRPFFLLLSRPALPPPHSPHSSASARDHRASLARSPCPGRPNVWESFFFFFLRPGFGFCFSFCLFFFTFVAAGPFFNTQ